MLSVNPKTEFVPSLFFSVPYFFTSASCLGQALAEAEGAGGGCLSVCLLGADRTIFSEFRGIWQQKQLFCLRSQGILGSMLECIMGVLSTSRAVSPRKKALHLIQNTMKLHLPTGLFKAVMATFALVAHYTQAETVTAWSTPEFGGPVFTWVGGSENWNDAANWKNANEEAASVGRVDNKGPVMIFGDGVTANLNNLGHGTDTSDAGGIIVGTGSEVTCGLGRWSGNVWVGEDSTLTTRFSQEQKNSTSTDKQTTHATFYVDGTLILDQEVANFTDLGGTRQFHIGKKGFIDFSKVTTLNVSGTLNLEVVVDPSTEFTPIEGVKNRVVSDQADVTRSIISSGLNLKDKFASVRLLAVTDTPDSYELQAADSFTVNYASDGVSVTYKGKGYAYMDLQRGGNFTWTHLGDGWTVVGGDGTDTTFMNGDSVTLTSAGTATVSGAVSVASFTLGEGVSYTLDIQDGASFTVDSGNAFESWLNENLTITGTDGKFAFTMADNWEAAGDCRIILAEGSNVGAVSVAGAFAYNLNNEASSSNLRGADLYLEDGSKLVIRNGVAGGASVDAGIGDIHVNGAAQLYVYGSANATITDKVVGASLDKRDGGSVTFAGGVEVDVLDVSQGTVNITSDSTIQKLWSGATLNLNSGVINAGQLRTREEGNSTVNINSGATLNVTGNTNDHSTSASILLAHWPGTGILNLNGGNFNSPEAMMKLSWSGKGIFNALRGEANIYGINAWAQSGFNGEFNLGSAADGSARVNIGGGHLVNMQGGAVINLGGGTLGATADWAIRYNANVTGSPASYINLISAQQGTTVDTLDAADETTARTITFENGLAGSGKLVKVGAGTLVLNGAAQAYAAAVPGEGAGTPEVPGFTGTVVLQEGALTVKDAGVIGGGKLLIGRGLTASVAQVTTGEGEEATQTAGTYSLTQGTLGVQGGTGVATLEGNLTLGGGTLSFDSLGTSEAALHVTGAVTLADSASVVVEWSGIGMSEELSTQYKVLSGTGLTAGATEAFELAGTLTDMYKGNFVVAADGTLTLTLSERTDMLCWNSGDWNTSAESWTREGNAAVYADGQPVFFTNEATGKTVNIAEGVTVNPSRMVVTGTDFTISGAGSIAGTGSLRVAEGASITIETANTYSGGTEIEKGAVVTIRNSSALGRAEGVAETKELGSISGTGTLVVDATNAVVAIRGNGAELFTGTLHVKSGYLYAGEVNNNGSGADASFRASRINVENGAEFSAHFGVGTLGAGLNSAKVISADVGLASGSTLRTVDGCVEFSGKVQFNVADLAAETPSYNAEGVTRLNTYWDKFINLSGLVEGSGEVRFSSSSGGSYLAISGNENTFDGIYSVNTSNTGIVLCADNAANAAGIRIDTGANFLRVQTAAAAISSLNGTSADALVYGSLGSSATLAISSGTYAGKIQDTANGLDAGVSLGIIKQGEGTLTLSGAMQYSGTTEVKSGLLAFTGTEPLTLGRIVMNAAAQLTTESALTLGAGASLAFDMSAPAADTSYISVNAGTLALTDASCNINLTNIDSLKSGQYVLASWIEGNSALSADKFKILGTEESSLECTLEIVDNRLLLNVVDISTTWDPTLDTWAVGSQFGISETATFDNGEAATFAVIDTLEEVNIQGSLQVGPMVVMAGDTGSYKFTKADDASGLSSISSLNVQSGVAEFEVGDLSIAGALTNASQMTTDGSVAAATVNNSGTLDIAGTLSGDVTNTGYLKAATIEGSSFTSTGGSLELSGADALNSTVATITNTELKGSWTAEGSGITIGKGTVVSGSVGLSGVSINSAIGVKGSASLDLSGNLLLSGFETENFYGYADDTKDGFATTSTLYKEVVVKDSGFSGSIISTNAQINGEDAVLNDDGSMTVHGEMGTQYWVTTNDVTYGGTPATDTTGATGFILNGADLNLVESLDSAMVDGIVVNASGSTLNIGADAVIAGSQISGTSAEKELTLAGSGKLLNGGATSLADGLKLSEGWKGTVVLDGVEVSTAVDISPLSTSDSVISLGDASLAAGGSLSASNSTLALEGVLSVQDLGASTMISAGKVEVGSGFDVVLAEGILSKEIDGTWTIVSSESAVANRVAPSEISGKSGKDNLYTYEYKWDDEGKTLSLVGSLAAETGFKDGATDVALVGGGVAENTLSSETTVGNLIVSNHTDGSQVEYTISGASLKVSGDLTVGTTDGTDVSLTVDNSITVKGNATVNNNGTLTMEGGSTLVVEKDLTADRLTIASLTEKQSTMITANKITATTAGEDVIIHLMDDVVSKLTDADLTEATYKLLSVGQGIVLDAANMVESGLSLSQENLEAFAKASKDVSLGVVPEATTFALRGAGTPVISLIVRGLTLEEQTWDTSETGTDRLALGTLSDGVMKLESNDILDSVRKVVVTKDTTLDLSSDDDDPVNINGLSGDKTLTVSGNDDKVNITTDVKQDNGTIADDGKYDGALKLYKVAAKVSGQYGSIPAGLGSGTLEKNGVLVGEGATAELDVNDSLVVLDGGSLSGDSKMVRGALAVKSTNAAIAAGNIKVSTGNSLTVSGTAIAIVGNATGNATDSMVLDVKSTGTHVIADLGKVNGNEGEVAIVDEQNKSIAVMDKYFSSVRLENGKVVADRNTSYYSDKADESLSANGAAGMQLADAVLVKLNPQATAPQGDLAGVLNMLDTATGAAADELGASLAGASTAVLGMAVSGDVDRQLQAIRNRTTTMGVDQSVANEDMPYFNAWINAEGDRSELSESGTEGGYELSSWGGTVGFDVDLCPTFTAGMALTAMYGDIDTTGADKASGNIDTYYVTAFARYAPSAWTHTFVATVGMSDISLDRHVAGAEMEGETDGLSFGLMYEVGRVFALTEDGSTCLQPVFNVTWKHTAIDAYTEDGSDLALEVDEQTLDTVTFGLGARLQTVVGESMYNRTSILEARVLAKADVGDRSGSADVAISALPGAKASVDSAEMGAFGLEAGAGLTIPVGDEGGSIFMDASVELRSDYTNVNGTVGYRINF